MILKIGKFEIHVGDMVSFSQHPLIFYKVFSLKKYSDPNILCVIEPNTTNIVSRSGAEIHSLEKGEGHG
jgi:hypothetical protein